MGALRAWALTLLLAASPLRAWQLEERALHAATVYNLMLFVSWPAETLERSREIALCVVSDDPETVQAFSGLSGKTLQGRSLRVHWRGALADLRSCHAVYFDRPEPGLLADKLASLAAQPVLTLSSGTPHSGAMIELSVADKRLVFDVSATGLREAGLMLAARVMQLARRVYP